MSLLLIDIRNLLLHTLYAERQPLMHADMQTAFSLDKGIRGSDQSSSVEPMELLSTISVYNIRVLCYHYGVSFPEVLAELHNKSQDRNLHFNMKTLEDIFARKQQSSRKAFNEFTFRKILEGHFRLNLEISLHAPITNEGVGSATDTGFATSSAPSINLKSIDVNVKETTLERIIAAYQLQQDDPKNRNHMTFRNHKGSYQMRGKDLSKLVKVTIKCPANKHPKNSSILTSNDRATNCISTELNCLAVKGFTFLEERFNFLCCKDFKSCAYFLRGDIEVASIWDKLLDFRGLPNTSIFGVRLGLLLSNSCPGGIFLLRRNDDAGANTVQVSKADSNNDSTAIQVQMIEDVFIQSPLSNNQLDAKRCCMTDGSGYISMDLALQLPNHVVQGQSINYGNTNDNGCACFQVRLFCVNLGLFKGTLVVDQSLPEKTILVRPSMLKVPPTSRLHQEDGSQMTTPYVFLDIVNTSRVPKSLFGQLNRHLVLLMHHNGVPEAMFSDIIRYTVRALFVDL